MFSVFRVSISPQILAPPNAVSIKVFSSKKSSSYVNGDYPKLSSTVSYLINTCRLSPKDAISISMKVTIKSPKNSDLVIELLRKYGFSNANIRKLITRWPKVLVSSPENTLLPKLNFFRSIGVPLEVLAEKICAYPVVLHRSLDNYLIPLYDYLKTFLQSDKRVVNVFIRAPRTFAYSWEREIPTNIDLLRQRGIPESSIVSLLANHPAVAVIDTRKLTSCIDLAVELGFDRTKVAFIQATQVFASMSESTLKQKREVYKKCGWSDSDISLAFLRYPICLKLSEKKIMDTMNFLVNDLGLKPAAVARLPILLCFNLDRRLKPRYFVARFLQEKGLLSKRISLCALVRISEEKFLKRYILNYQEDVPQLLDIYRGKLSVSEIG